MKSTKAFKLGNCQILPLEFSIQFENSNKQSLQPKLIDVLVYLAKNYPRIITRDELIEHVWLGNNYVGEKALTNAIWHLRKSLKDVSHDDEVIETIRKAGYRLLVEPEWQENSDPSDTQISQSGHDKSKFTKLLPLFIVFILLFVGMFYWQLNDKKPAFSQAKITQITREPGRELFVAPSPNGRFIVYKWYISEVSSGLFILDRQQPQLPAKQLTFEKDIVGHSVWSIDSEYLYFSRYNRDKSQCHIVQMKVTSRQEKIITDCALTGGYSYIDISPDGKTLAYQGHIEAVKQRGIYFFRLDQENAQPIRFSCLENCGYRDRDMAFSPDGKKIAVSRRFSRFVENIYLIDLNTGASEQLTFGEEDIVGLTWHPDGEKLVFATQRADVRQGFVYDVKSKNSLNINIEGFSYPAFAKNSGQLFYQHRKEQYHIASLKLNETIATSPFPIAKSEFNHHYPDYSSVTKRIVFISNESGHYELWSANSDGDKRKQLTFLKQAIRYPRWSHDGSKIAFLAPLEKESGDKIFILDMNSLRVSELKSPYKEHNRPTWSFDDSAIISAIYDNEYTDLFQININDGTTRRLTYDGGRYGIMISPTRLLYTRIKNGLWEKDIEDTSEILLRINGELFKTLYTWTVLKNQVFFRQNAADHQQLSFYDFKKAQLTPLARMPALSIANYSSLTLAPERGELLFTGSDKPQADIKMLEHPLLE